MGINSIISFVVEVLAVIFYAFLPFVGIPGLPLVIKIVTSIGLVALFITLWAKFAAPRSTNRLMGTHLFIFKALVLLPALITPTISYGILIAAIAVILVAVNLIVEKKAAGR